MNLFENLQLMKEAKDDSVITICYNQKQHWDNRQDAIDFFYEGMMSTEGSESNRYQKIYSELMSGKKYVLMKNLILNQYMNLLSKLIRDITL